MLLCFALSASAVDYYLIGDNVNGKNWTLKDPDAKFTPVEGQTGVYTLNVKTLGTGFKINNGSWGSINIGAQSTSKKLTVGTPFSYTNGNMSQNISFNGVTKVENAVVTLDTNAKTILVSGQGSGKVEWYVAGLNDASFKLDDAHKMTASETEGVYVLKDFEITKAGSFKVATSGWGIGYGWNDKSVTFSENMLSHKLEEVSGETGDVPYTMTGKYNITWNNNTKTVTFESSVPQIPQCATPIIGDGSAVYTVPVGFGYSPRAKCEDPADAKLYYTLDGSTPTAQSTYYKGGNYSIQDVKDDCTIRMIAIADGYRDSKVAEQKVIFSTCNNPTFSSTPSADMTAAEYTVTLLCATKGAKIYYAFDPDVTDKSTLYTEPIKITSRTTLYCRAYKEGKTESKVMSQFFAGPDMKCPAPVLSPEGGVVTQNRIEVHMKCGLAGTKIYYTMDGTDPVVSVSANGTVTATNGKLYDFRYPQSLREDAVIKAVAVRGGYENSDIVSERYTFSTCPSPVISSDPAPNVESDKYTVTISCILPEAKIYYTIDGSDVTEQSTLYTKPFVITKSCTVKAMTVCEGRTGSGKAQQKFTCTTQYEVQPFYLIGDNVNGKKWSLKAADAKFVPVDGQDGVYTLSVKTLGTGFKINDGTWSKDEYNFGSNGKALELGKPYKYGVGGSTGNIAIAGATVVENAKLTLDINNGTVQVDGEGEGEISWYVAGIDDASFNLDDKHMMEETETEGVFVLRNFKIAAPGHLKVATTGWGESYGTNDKTKKFSLASLSQVLEPVAGETGDIEYTMTGVYDITWTLATKTLAFKSVGQQEEITYYLIGNGVDGKNWQLKDEAHKFIKQTEGIYKVHADVLLSGFKVNDGTWTNDAVNIGGNGTDIKIGVPYQFGVGGTTSNINFADKITSLRNADVTLNMIDRTITVTGQTEQEDFVWYIPGLNDPDFKLDDAHKFTATKQEGVFELKGFNITAVGSFKVATQNWFEQYGAVETTSPISENNLSTVLSAVTVDCEVPYSITGTYDITWNYNTKTVKFTKSSSGVEDIMAEDAEAVYYNLSGIKVNAGNLQPGLYIKVVNGTATKIAIK